jgi:hypothetical protein
MAITYTAASNGTGRIAISETVSTVTSSSVIPVDLSIPTNIGFGVIANATINYDVQHTFDPDPVNATDWFPHESVDGAIASADGNYAFGITGIKLVVNSVTGGDATLYVVQTGRK